MTKERKIIVIIGAILLFFGIIYRFSLFSFNINDIDDELDIKMAKIAKYQKMTLKRNILDANLLSLIQTLAKLESNLLSGQTSALAAVDLQNIINNIASLSKIEIQAINVLKAEKTDNPAYLSIPVRFTVSLTIRQLKDILYKIEYSQKIIRIRDISIVDTERIRGQKISLNIMVEGFMKASNSNDISG